MPLFIATFFTFFFHLNTFAHDLRNGDIILQPLNCWSCSLIEGEEDTIFSHMGIVSIEDQKIYVYEAYLEVRKVTLEHFLEKTQQGQKNTVLRLNRDDFNFSSVKEDFEQLLGNPYDRGFLWDNLVDGKESLYCSEFVYKVLVKKINFVDLRPKKMHFDFFYDHWKRYFNGNVPVGELGISPGDFERSRDFIKIMEI